MRVRFTPSDLLALIPPAAPASPSLILGCPRPWPQRHWQPAVVTAVDDATTLLAALRRRPDRARTALGGVAVPPLTITSISLPRAPLLITFLRQQGVVQSAPLRPTAADTKSWARWLPPPHRPPSAAAPRG